MSDPIDVYEQIKALRAMGEVVSQADVDWLIERTEYLLTLTGRAEVARLEAKAAALLGSDFQAGTVDAALDWLSAEVARLQAEVERQAALIRGPLSQAISEARDERDEARAEVARLTQERSDALNVTSREGLLKSDFQAGTVDAALDCLAADVSLLRALLDEPSEEEAERLATNGWEAWNAPSYASTTARAVAFVRAILDDLRERAGGGE